VYPPLRVFPTQHAGWTSSDRRRPPRLRARSLRDCRRRAGIGGARVEPEPRCQCI